VEEEETDAQRCRSCVLPKTYSAVSFDEDGVCSLCRDHGVTVQKEREVLESRRAELADLAVEAKAGGGQYDCIVPVSGGRDSAYVAYYVRHQLGLRPLGVNFDNGYRSPQALANLESMTRKLDMDLVTLRPAPDLVRAVFAHFFKTCGYFCVACDALGYVVIGSFVAREARRTGHAPLVVGGWSRKYEYQPGLSVLSMSFFGETLRKDAALFAKLRSCPLVEPAVLTHFTEVEDIRQMSNLSGMGAKLVQLPDYVDWDYSQIGKTLEEELGWEIPSGGREAHFDCRLAPLGEYLKCRRFGFSQEDIRNSVLVREGRMSRDEALDKTRLAQTTEPEVLQEALAEWGMTAGEVAWDAEWPH
jgi:hypothetical protein